MEKFSKVLCVGCCILCVVALALILMHQSKVDIHRTEPGPVVSPDVDDDHDGDQEPGSKRFDHLELMNISGIDVTNMKFELFDANLQPVPNGVIELGSETLSPGESIGWVMMDGGAGTAYVRRLKVTLTHMKENPQGTPQTYQQILTIDAGLKRSLRSATLWFGQPPMPTGALTPNEFNLCGEALTETTKLTPKVTDHSRVIGHTAHSGAFLP